MDSLNELKYSWNEFAEEDAMWAVLTGKQWDEASFYKTGQEEVDYLMNEVQAIHPKLSKDRALDFGCGLGRLSYALATHFDRVIGVDISSKMIDKAAANSRANEKVEFILNEAKTLVGIPSNSIDFLLSLIVLQHIPRKFIKGYLREFLRVTKPGGIIVFQILTRKFWPEKKELYWEGRPLRWDSPPLGKLCYRAVVRFLRYIPRKINETTLKHDRLQNVLYFWKRWDGKPNMQMNTMKKASLEKFLKKNGGMILKSKLHSGEGDLIESFTYFVVKQDS